MTTTTETEVVRGGNTSSPDRNRPAKTWDITINNYTDSDVSFLENLECSKKIISKEVGEKGTPHLQGRMTFKRTYRFTQLKKLHSKAHWSITECPQDFNYIMKEDSEIIIKEDNRKQGYRTDLVKIYEEIKEGKTVEQITIEAPIIYHQYGRTLEKLEDIVNRKKFRTEMTKCEWLYGETGVGKSHKAFENYSEDTHYLWTNDGGWWDGYRGQEIVVINDFRGEIPYNMMLQLIDKWPMKVRRRNREPMPFVSKMIYITSSLRPDQIYRHRDEEDNIAQLLRRIKVTECKKNEPPEVPKHFRRIAGPSMGRSPFVATPLDAGIIMEAGLHHLPAASFDPNSAPPPLLCPRPAGGGEEAELLVEEMAQNRKTFRGLRIRKLNKD